MAIDKDAGKRRRGDLIREPIDRPNLMSTSINVRTEAKYSDIEIDSDREGIVFSFMEARTIMCPLRLLLCGDPLWGDE